MRVLPPFVVRLDMRNGRALTKRWFKEENRLSCDFAQMITTVACEIMAEEPYYSLAYTGSDEISLLGIKDGLPFSGRVEKLLSISAGMASSVLTRLLIERSIKEKHVEFDARVVCLSREEIRQYINERRGLVAANAINWYLCANGQDAIKIEKAKLWLHEQGVEIPAVILLGSLVYRERLLRVGRNPITGQETVVARYAIAAAVAEDRVVDRVISSILCDCGESQFLPS